VRSIGRMGDVRPSTATLRMFDKSKLQTSGVITLSVQHPRTLSTHELQFHVATKHEQPLLGFHTCRALQLLRIVKKNIYEAQAELLLVLHRQRRASRRGTCSPSTRTSSTASAYSRATCTWRQTRPFLISDIAIIVLKRDVKLQLTN